MSNPTEREEPRDCSGGLEGLLVRADFQPACGNCALKAWCAEALPDAPNPADRPKHDAFPHTWHWDMRGPHFPEGKDEVGLRLITRAWVGISVYGARHTGCYEYRVDPRYTIEAERMLKYVHALHVTNRERVVNARLDEIEAKYATAPDRAWPPAIEAEWRRLMDEQEELLARLDELTHLPKGTDVELPF